MVILFAAISWILPAGTYAAFQSLQKESVGAVAFVGSSGPVAGLDCTDIPPGTKILPPVLTINPINPISGAAPSLQVTGVTNAAGCVQQVSMYYKKTFDSDVKVLTSTIPANVHSTTFTFTVPSDLVTSEGVMVQVKTVDMSSNTVLWPSTGYALIEVSGYAQATIGPAGGALFVPNSFERSAGTMVSFPPNALTQDTKISATELNPLNFSSSRCADYRGIAPVTLFSFEPSGIVFNRPVSLSILYPDRNRDGTIDGTDKDQRLAQIFLCTDTGWQPLGGNVNTDTKVVSTRILHFSVYGVFPATPLAPEDYRPVQRIITPSRADGQNDQAVFGYMGPDMRIEIFDSTGRRLRTLQNTTVWDGRDDQGKIVESGVYIYQYEKDGKRISGAIAVAK